MGMGKTVQTISLLLTDFDADASSKKRKHTLVVAPTVAIVQWRNEIAKYTDVFKVRSLGRLDRLRGWPFGTSACGFPL